MTTGETMETEISKEQLLAILQENRANHREIFEEALDGWRKHAIGQLEAKLTELREGTAQSIRLSYPPPTDQTRDYDRAIRMIELNVRDTIVLDEESTANFVMDDWGWQQRWLLDNSAYSAGASQRYEEAYGDIG
jgi:hypothetical protein